MLKAVTFDFWNTLYADTNFNERLTLRVNYMKTRVEDFGHQKSHEEIEKAFEEAGKKWLRLWEEESRSFTPFDITAEVFKRLDVRLSAEEIIGTSRGISEIALEVPPVMVKGVKGVLEELSLAYRIGLISDTGATGGRILKRIMEKDGIAKYFDSFVFSDEILSTKPSKKNFNKALDTLGSDPEDAVHIGDIERTDVEGAKSAGMKAVLFRGVNTDPHETTKADLVIMSYEGLPHKLIELSNG